MSSTATTTSSVPDKISFAEPDVPRLSSTYDGEFYSDDEYSVHPEPQDWSKTTDEKDSWANQERRRGNKFSTIDPDMHRQSTEAQARRRRKPSSALGMFGHGVDKNGKPITLSDDHHDDLDVDPAILEAMREKQSPKALSSVFPNPNAGWDERRASMSSQNSGGRRGSILSMFKPGSNKMHSGHDADEEYDDENAISLNGSTEGGSGPSSPFLAPPAPDAARNDRRGSILSIWRQGKDKRGNAVMHSGEAHDKAQQNGVEEPEPEPEEISLSEDKGKEKEEDKRAGSILSMWGHGKDQKGGGVILSGDDEHEDIPTPEELPVEPRGGDRRGSMLSMWTEGRERDQTHRPGKVKLAIDEEE